MIRAWAAQEKAGAFSEISYDPGEIRADEVEIAVEACGLCHSDLSLLDEEWGETAFPLVPGHEVVGTIRAMGKGVRHLKTGQRVGVGWLARSCLTCNTCMSGDHNLCASAQGIAVGRFGGFGEAVRVQAAWAVPLPEVIDARAAGPLFCGGITVFAPIVAFNVKPTDRVGVIGIGGLGHLALQFLKAWGCEVTAFTSTGAKAEEAKKFGAHRIVDSRSKDALKAEAGRYDFILSTVAVPLDWKRYIAALAPKGRLHTVGAVSEPLEIPAFSLIGGQKSVSGSPVGSPAVMAQMLEFCARHQIIPQVEYMPMSRIDDAFQRLREGKPRYRIVLENDFA
jgi:alcohol/geraniol dehydrogenase (NADP+)